MKKITALILSSVMLLSAAACSQGNGGSSSEETTAEQTTEAPVETQTAVEGEIQEKINESFAGFNISGVCFVVRDGVPIASYADGSFYDGTPIMIDSPMAVGSVSKQFCAAAIMKLSEEGKLSVEDTLDKYFPEYREAGRITIHQMLSMTSGVPDLPSDPEEAEALAQKITMDNTDEQNTAAVLDYIFNAELSFEPGTSYEYSNCNYILLGNIVEKLSGQKYIDFLRENFFAPLNMTHTGSLFELKDDPEWAKGFSYEYDDLKYGIEPGLSKGAGDIVSNADDMMLWLDGISSGKVLSEESFKKMSTDQTGGNCYGYGLRTDMSDGAGHFGLVGRFAACDFISADGRLRVFIATNSGGGNTLENRFYEMIGILV